LRKREKGTFKGQVCDTASHRKVTEVFLAVGRKGRSTVDLFRGYFYLYAGRGGRGEREKESRRELFSWYIFLFIPFLVVDGLQKGGGEERGGAKGIP